MRQAFPLHQQAAVDADDLPGNVRGLWSGQEGHRIPDLVGAPDPTEGDSFKQLRALRLGEVLRGHIGLDEAGWPNLERVGSYATPRDILRRSVDELKKLRELKLGIFYTGVESGDEEVLLKVGKGVNSGQLIEAGRKAKQAGITLSLTVILGLGGIEGSRKHVLETARVLSAIDP